MTKRVQGRLFVDAMRDLHDPKMPVRNEERAQGAVEVLYRSPQHPSQPLGAILKLGKALCKGCERADLQQPIKLYRMRGSMVPVVGIHPDILGIVA